MSEDAKRLDAWYSTPDPWAYKTHPSDQARKDIILKTLEPYGPFSTALDIGAGEAWLTQDLPAQVLHGLELSDVAAARFPASVGRVHQPMGQYDLVLATGVLYDHYNVEQIVKWVNDAAARIILTCNIATWESPQVKWIKGREVFQMTFAYREWQQMLRVFRI